MPDVESHLRRLQMVRVSAPSPWKSPSAARPSPTSSRYPSKEGGAFFAELPFVAKKMTPGSQ